MYGLYHILSIYSIDGHLNYLQFLVKSFKFYVFNFLHFDDIKIAKFYILDYLDF